MAFGPWTEEVRANVLAGKRAALQSQFSARCAEIGIKVENWWFDIIDFDDFKKLGLPPSPSLSSSSRTAETEIETEIDDTTKEKYDAEIEYLREWLDLRNPGSADVALFHGGQKIGVERFMKFTDHRLSLQEKMIPDGQLSMLDAFEVFEVTCQAYTSLTGHQFGASEYSIIRKAFRQWTGLHDFNIFIQIEKYERAMTELQLHDGNAVASGSVSGKGIKRPAENSHVEKEEIPIKKLKRREGHSEVLEDEHKMEDQVESVHEAGQKDEERVIKRKVKFDEDDAAKVTRVSNKNKGKGKMGSKEDGKKVSKRSLTTR